MSEKKSNSLINGRFLKCPRCEEEEDVLKYVPLKEITKFAKETCPIYKCPNCKWCFALSLYYEQVFERRF